MSARFAVFDIDGTLIRWQLFHAIVHSLGKKGYIRASAHSHIRRVRMEWKTRTSPDGFMQYETTLLHEYQAALNGIDIADYALIVQEIFDKYKDQTYTYTRSLVRRLKHEGYVLFAISGSHDEIIQKLARYYGFDDAIGAVFEQVNGRFSGVVDTPVFDKAKALDRLLARHSLDTKGSIGVGDSSSDAPMLEMVDHPVVFNPDKKMFTIAKTRKWDIVVERKNMVYELQIGAGGAYTLQV